MGIALLKKLNQKMPDRLKSIFAPLIRKQLVGNPIFLEQYSLLDTADSQSEKENKSQQLELLKICLTRAYENVPYYKELFDKCDFSPYAFSDFGQIEKIPFLEKETIQRRFSDLVDDTCEDFYEATTGGSSGIATCVSLDRASIYKERAFIYHFWSKFGYNYTKSKLATFRGIPGKKNTKLNPLYGEIQLTPFNLNDKTVHEYVKAIDRFGAEFIQGYPSSIANFCMLAREKSLALRKPMKAVFLISENLLDWQRAEIENYFSCPIVPFYGHTERAVFAECDQGLDLGYRFNSLYGYTEVLDDGTVICTGFINPRMPLIRYKLDDAVFVTKEPYYLVEGHRDGVALIGKNGEKITQTSFEGMHVKALAKVSAYQLVQNNIGECDFLFMAEEKLNQIEIDRIAEELNRGIASLEWTPKQVETFQLTDRGKFKPIIVNISKKGN